VRLLKLASDSLRQRLERRRTTPERALARRGEDLAHRFLERNGYRIVARNYRTHSGGNEVDLIAWHRGHLAVIEVKTRSADDYGTPDRAITPEKRKRVVRAAMDYARRAKADPQNVRFDVVTVIDGRPPRVELFADAFSATSV